MGGGTNTNDVAIQKDNNDTTDRKTDRDFDLEKYRIDKEVVGNQELAKYRIDKEVKGNQELEKYRIDKELEGQNKFYDYMKGRGEATNKFFENFFRSHPVEGLGQGQPQGQIQHAQVRPMQSFKV